MTSVLCVVSLKNKNKKNKNKKKQCGRMLFCSSPELSPVADVGQDSDLHRTSRNSPQNHVQNDFSVHLY